MNNMNTRQNDGGAVFPTKGTFHGAPYQSDGMTLRDWFAGQAVSGLYADHQFTGSHVEAARCSYALADAMIAKRNERQES